MRISLGNSSTISPRKRRQSYIKKLTQQITTVEEQVKYFNNHNKSYGKNQIHTVPINLKKLTEPKYQNFLLNQNFNPEKNRVSKMEKQNKFFKLFRNNSAISEADFTANQFMMDMAKSNLNGQNFNTFKTGLQIKVQNRLSHLNKQWDKVDDFRKKNWILDTHTEGDFQEEPNVQKSQTTRNMRISGIKKSVLRGQQKISSILDKIEKRRPFTAQKRFLM